MRQLAATLSTLFALTAPLAAPATASRLVDWSAVANVGCGVKYLYDVFVYAQ